jgi:hypothetical protein
VLVVHEIQHERLQRENVAEACQAFVRKLPDIQRAAYVAPSGDRHLLLEGVARRRTRASSIFRPSLPGFRST